MTTIKSPGKLKVSSDYRVKQPIENFKLRIKIVQQKSQLAELFEEEGGGGEETRDTNFLDCKERTIGWQEKILSQFEVNHYKEKNNCLTEVEREYHEKISSNEITQGSRLYTYVEKDVYNKQDKSPITKQGYKSFLSKKNKTALPSLMRNMKPFSERYNKEMINESPSENRIRTNHYLYTEKIVMHVMVDLTSKDEAFSEVEDSEVLLCTVTFDRARKILTLDPDFTSNEPYTLEKTGMTFYYWIYHASKTQINQDKTREENILKENVEIYKEIKLPGINILRIYLTIELTRAWGFCYDALFLSYLIDLPGRWWSTSQPERLSGRSQRCRMTNGVANFGYVTEIMLDLNLDCLKEENIHQVSWPQLLISAASLDSWTRYRIEGYASQALFQTPGNFSIELKMWRPVAGFLNTLRRFFTGGTAELDDLTYSGVPRNHEGSVLDKAQLNVVPSGSVEIRINSVQQCRDFAKDRGSFRENLDRLNAGRLINSVDTVLEQFKIARERMIRARAINS